MPQTICATGMGESFSSCNSTMESVSLKSLSGNWATRRKTCSGGSHATLSLRCQSVRQSLLISRAGNGSPVKLVCSRLRTKPPFRASNCQSCRASAPTWSTLQECQRVFIPSSTFHPHFAFRIIHQGIQVLLDLGDAQDFLDGGQAGPHFVPTVSAERAHPHFDGLIRDCRGGRSIED